MATIASQTSGNWSDPSTWVGGAIPGPLDEAQAITGHVINIDTDFTVQRLSHTGNGKFVLTGATPRTLDITISATLAVNATGTCLLELDGSYSAENTSISIASISLGSHTGTTALGLVHIVSGSTGSVKFFGNSWAGDSSSSGNEPSVVLNSSTVDVEITMTVALAGSSNTYSSGYQSTADSSLVINSPKLDLITAVVIQGGSFGSPFTKTSTINSPIITGAASNPCIMVTGHKPIIINGDIGGVSTNGGQGARFTDSSPVTINGNIKGSGAGTNNYGAGILGSNTSIVVNGNVIGGEGSTGSGGIVATSVQATLVVNGDVMARQSSGNANAGITFSTVSSRPEASYITINGNVLGGPGDVGLSVSGNSPGGAHIFISGNVLGGSNANTSQTGKSGVIQNSTNGTVTVEGTVISASSGTGGSGLVVGTVTASSAVIGKAGQTTSLINTTMSSAIDGSYVLADDASLIWRFMGTNSVTDIELIPPLTTADSDLSPSDVRDGVVYDSDNKVGTMIVPDVDDVLVDVPVDDTIGTAHITLADAAAITGSQISSLST